MITKHLSLRGIKSLFVVSLVYFTFFIVYPAHASISFDTANQVNSPNVTNTNVSLTIAEENEMLLCFVADDVLNNDDSLTFNGESMTKFTTVTDTSGYFELWGFYLADPATGTHNVSASRTSGGTGKEWLVHCAAYKGASLVVPEASSTLADSSGTTHSGNITTLTPNAWTIMYGLADSGGMSAGASSTLRGSILIGASALFDSDGGVNPEGTHSMTFNSNNGLGTALIVSLAPVVPISFDTANQVNSPNVTNTNVSLTIAEENEMLLCFVADDVLNNDDSLTFNGESMTKFTTVTDTSGYFELWGFYLADPATGTHNVSASRTSGGTGKEWLVHCAAYKNVEQNIPGAFSVQADSPNTSHTTHVATQTSGAWTIMYGLADSGGMSAGASSTLRGSILIGASALFDSDGGETLNGMTFNSNSGLGTAISVVLAPID